MRVAGELRLSGNVSRHDFVRADGSSDAATALGADLEYGGFRNGTHVQLGVVGGGNWRHEQARASSVPGFLAWQAVVSRYFPLEGRGLEALEPMARASWGDPHRGGAADAGLLLTPGLFLYVKGRNRIGVNLDVYRDGSGHAEYSLKLQTYLHY